MIDYDTYSKIHYLHSEKHLRVAEIARRVKLSSSTVKSWLNEKKYRHRKSRSLDSLCAPYTENIQDGLKDGYSLIQIYNELIQKCNYTGGYTTLKDYARNQGLTKRKKKVLMP